jgi:DNA segregation ATPase FtsK/SpoIIIE, S-DNA-T family
VIRACEKVFCHFRLLKYSVLMAKVKKSKKEEEDIEKEELPSIKDIRWKRIAGLTIILMSALFFMAITSHLFSGNADEVLVPSVMVDDYDLEYTVSHERNILGKFGAFISKWLVKYMFGICSYFIVFLMFVYGVNIIFDKKIFKLKKLTFHSVFLMFYLASFLEYFRFLFFKNSFFHPGGLIGYKIAGASGWLFQYIKPVGTGFFILFVGLIYLIWNYNLSFDFILSLFKRKDLLNDADDENTKQVTIGVEESIFERDNLIDLNDSQDEENEFELVASEVPFEEETEEDDDDEGLNFTVTRLDNQQESVNEPESVVSEGPVLDIDEGVDEKVNFNARNMGNYDPTLDLSNYKYPPLEYLEEHGSGKVGIDEEELMRNKNQIVNTLKNYNIDIAKIKATVGPTVTLYEIVPAPGVRISKIKNLEDDIALSLSALGIRIIAPIPGKGTIGIEVPNARKEVVSMRTILASEKFRTTEAELPVGLGKNIANEIFIADLAKMPHLLMAGATGQGKSVGINAILVSLLYKKHPSQLKFVLVDPKKVELSIYSTIEKHFLAKLPGEEEPIITDVKKVVHTLNALCLEMDERYDLLKEAKARNIKEYNQKFIQRELNPLKGHKFLPYIVLVIDEFADLIMTAGKEVETPIARLAQLARAIGIHIILATQRPSVNIITGVIKANFPARISFKVSSKIDSRTILDAGGADQLIGRGDMLFSQGSDMVRLQCAFVDTPEVEKIVDFIHKQQGYPDAFMLPEYVDPNEDNDAGGNYSAEDRDPLFEDAARVVVINQMGSTSLIQRRLKLGYNRAGRLMDQLEDAGIVGPNMGSKARDVYPKSEAELEQYLQRGN